MDKNSLVSRFQIARLDEWIGDFNSAIKEYDELGKLDQGLAKILKTSVEKRKKKARVKGEKKGVKNRSKAVSSLNYARLDTFESPMIAKEPLLLFDPKNLTPKSDFSKLDAPQLTIWKYSISTVSKVDKMLRLEIRGFNPNGALPKLGIELQGTYNHWKLEQGEEPNSGSPDLIWLYGKHETLDSEIYLAVDRWGLLSGTVLVKEEQLGDSLINSHILISYLSGEVW